MTEATTLDESQSRLLGALTIASVQRLGGDAVCVDQDNRFRSWRMARVNDLVLIDQAADETGPRSINCYFAKAEEIDPASGFAEDGVRFKIDPSRLLFALHWLHRGEPPDLDLTLVRDPATWYEFVADSLMNALNQHDPHMRHVGINQWVTFAADNDRGLRSFLTSTPGARGRPGSGHFISPAGRPSPSDILRAPRALQRH